jgi:hypothetical protein
MGFIDQLAPVRGDPSYDDADLISAVGTITTVDQ